jgi:putative ABC transport system permease protein
VKFLPLFAANFLRRKTRTILTLGSFAVALFLFGLLFTVRAAFNMGVDLAAADRLWVINKVSLIQPLPLAYRDRIAKVPGIKALTYASWFGGVYQDPKYFFPQFAIDEATYRDVFPEFQVGDEGWQAFLADRQGLVVGKALADRFNWKVGDHIPLQGAAFPGVWEFNLHAIYTGKRPNDDLTQFWFHAKYLEEKGPDFMKGIVGWYVVRLEEGASGVDVTRGIDGRFANSPWETRTQTESEFNTAFVKQMGNIEFLILSIGGIVFFTLLLVTGNTMAMSVRERTGELAVLKTVGFTDGFVLVLVLVESALMAALGGTLGIGLAKALTMAGDPTHGMLPGFYLSPLGVATGIALALVVGLLAGLIPAWSAMRLQVVDALRRF